MSVPVSKPRLWPLSSLADRPTCWGEPVTVRCGCATGTAVHYAWYKKAEKKYEDVQLNNLSDLYLHCGTLDKNIKYYCTATNDISHQESDILSVQLLIPGHSSCAYVITMYDQPIYDCADRMTTTTQIALLTTCQTLNITSDTGNQSSTSNQTYHGFFEWAWTSMSFWYTLLRWCCFLSLLISLCIGIKCGR